MKQRFRVGGMSCAACSAHVEKSVSAVPGVSGVQVNLLAGSMAVEYDENACDAPDDYKGGRVRRLHGCGG